MDAAHEDHQNRPVNHQPFSWKLRRRARRIAQGLEGQLWNSSVRSVIERDIALTLSHLENIHQGHARAREDLDKLKEYLLAEYRILHSRVGYRLTPWLIERDKLGNRLSEVHREQRSIALSEHKEVQALEDRLLSLVHKHRFLKF